MSKRRSEYDQRPGESEADHIARLTVLDVRDQEIRQAAAEEDRRSHWNVAFLIDEAKTVADFKEILRLMNERDR